MLTGLCSRDDLASDVILNGGAAAVRDLTNVSRISEVDRDVYAACGVMDLVHCIASVRVS